MPSTHTAPHGRWPRARRRPPAARSGRHLDAEVLHAAGRAHAPWRGRGSRPRAWQRWWPTAIALSARSAGRRRPAAPSRRPCCRTRTGYAWWSPAATVGLPFAELLSAVAPHRHAPGARRAALVSTRQCSEPRHGACPHHDSHLVSLRSAARRPCGSAQRRRVASGSGVIPNRPPVDGESGAPLSWCTYRSALVGAWALAGCPATRGQRPAAWPPCGARRARPGARARRRRRPP